MRGGIARYLKDRGGNAAVEFALLIPLLSALVFGIVSLGSALYATTTMHWAAEAAARCAVISINYATAPTGDPTVSCQTRSSTATFATSIYKGPVASPSFTATEVSSTSGGHTYYCRRVAGTGTFKMNAVFTTINIPISVQSCFPEAAPTTAWP